jgi:Helicase conserved C-terminal domain
MGAWTEPSDRKAYLRSFRYNDPGSGRQFFPVGRPMFYSYSREREQRAAHERGWRRAELVAWEEKWRRLSPPARLAFVTETKSPIKKGRSSYTVRPGRFVPAILEELRAAGFVEVEQPSAWARLPNVVVPDPVRDFAHYVRSLYRFHLLDATRANEFLAYIGAAFTQQGLASTIDVVLRHAGIRGHIDAVEALGRYVVSHRWPTWVVAGLPDGLARPTLDALRDAERPLTLPELSERVKANSPGELRMTLDLLVARLAVVEDLRPQTWDVVFGLLPPVREGLILGAVTRSRPALRLCEQPSEVAPEGGWLVNALRAFLLEVAAEPPRLKQGGDIFQKEEERLQEALGPVPACLHNQFNVNIARQFGQALHWAKLFGFTEDSHRKERRLQLSEPGRNWLAGSVEEQYAALYKMFQRLPGEERNPEYYCAPGDRRFLGDDVRVARAAPTLRVATNWWDVSAEQARDLRNALHDALAVLEPGRFYDLDSVLRHLSFGPHNPLLLGRQANEVQVRLNGSYLAPLDEELEPAARQVLDTFLKERLLPFGAVQAGVDGAGRPIIARLPRFDAYFGGEVTAADLAGTAAGEARVVVQPDFSVTVIGLNPAPAAELAPFCERVRGHPGEGALILKITRDSVVKAVMHGLPAPEILARLERQSSTAVPANVLREVRDWCAWVRQVAAGPLVAIRCPDGETADRVASALGKRAERLTDTVVAVAEQALSSADRNKLLKQGVVVSQGR